MEMIDLSNKRLLLEKFDRKNMTIRVVEDGKVIREWYNKNGDLDRNPIYGGALEDMDSGGSYFYANGEEIGYYNNNTYDKQISNLLKEFDFDKVHKAMVALEWRWWHCNGTPDVSELKKTSKRKLRECVKNVVCSNTNYFFISSGGLKAEYFKETNSFKLSFIVERWMT